MEMLLIPLWVVDMAVLHILLWAAVDMAALRILLWVAVDTEALLILLWVVGIKAPPYQISSLPQEMSFL